MPNEQPYLIKGSHIKCPKCKKSVLKLADDIFYDECVMEEHIELRDKYKNKFNKPKNGDRIKCLACNEMFTGVARIDQFNGVFTKAGG